MCGDGGGGDVREDTRNSLLDLDQAPKVTNQNKLKESSLALQPEVRSGDTAALGRTQWTARTDGGGNMSAYALALDPGAQKLNEPQTRKSSRG